MIHNQPDDTIELFGFEYKMVTVVAVVRNIEHTSTKITYQLEDISGKNRKLTVNQHRLTNGQLKATLTHTTGSTRRKQTQLPIFAFTRTYE